MENQLKATELRCGNLLEYFTAESDTTLMKVNWHSLRWISEDETGFNLVHSPIQLTEDILVKLGFKTDIGEPVSFADYGENPITKDYIIELKNTGEGWFYRNGHFKIEFLHQLQNLIHSLTGEEITFKD